MKKFIFLVIVLFIVFPGISQEQTIKREVIVTGTINGYYPPGYSGKVNLAFTYYNPKSEAYVNYSPSFQSADSFYLRFSIEQPKLINVLYLPVYLVPGDSVHVEYKYTEDNEKRISKSWFSKVYSNLGYDGNIGYRSYINSQRSSFLYQVNPKDNPYPTRALDSAYTNLASLTQDYFERQKVSSDYKKIIENDLLLLKVSRELDLVQGDSEKIIQTLEKYRYLFRNDAYNSSSYFIAVGSLQAAFASLYPDMPAKALAEMKKYLSGDTYLYAALIFSNVLTRKLPLQANPYSAEVALYALDSAKDTDLKSFANLILSKLSVQKESNKLFHKIKVRDYHGNVFSMGDVLAQQAGKLKYIDLWASWCGPCIKEIPNSKKLSERFKNDTIRTVFISIDQDTSGWQKAYREFNMQNEESYCVLDRENLDSLSKMLQLSSIPRYLIVDGNNALQTIYAPKPGRITRDFLIRYLRHKNSSLPGPPPPPKKN